MELPSVPTAAHLASQASKHSHSSSPPITSPISSRPPSPVQRVSYAYPETAPSTPASSAPPSRSASHSKNPLLKRQREPPASSNGVAGFFASLLGGTYKSNHGQEELELAERRGRRVSMGQVEAAFDERRRAELQRAGRDGASSVTSPTKEKLPWYKMNKARAQLIVSFAMIALVGMNDSATGANLDAMQEHYKRSYDQMSLLFLSNTAGYFISSMAASFVLHHWGLQISLALACAGMSIGCTLLAIAPPFPVFVISLSFLGFGGGMYDACITTIVSHEEDGVLMSLLYSFFGVGAMFSPLIIGSFIDKGWSWQWYYIMPLSISLILLIAGFFVFSGYEVPADEAHDAPLSTAQAPEASTMGQQGEVIHGRAVMSAKERMKRALRIRAVWVGFFLCILAFASSDTLSAWVVSFMVQKRASPAAASRYMLSGVWGGIATGRIVLAYLLGKRMGEKAFAILMLFAASGMLAILYVRNFVVDAVAMVLVGFFFGPVTPKVLSAASARVPPSLKASVMSLTIGLGLIGSSVGPLLFGIVAGRGGLSSLPAVLIGMSVCGMVGWVLMPRNRRRED
ncbi:hypothetical protein JCM11251_004691 [Rhodosporidiobolus azoricus]